MPSPDVLVSYKVGARVHCVMGVEPFKDDDHQIVVVLQLHAVVNEGDFYAVKDYCHGHFVVTIIERDLLIIDFVYGLG